MVVHGYVWWTGRQPPVAGIPRSWDSAISFWGVGVLVSTWGVYMWYRDDVVVMEVVKAITLQLLLVGGVTVGLFSVDCLLAL